MKRVHTTAMASSKTKDAGEIKCESCRDVVKKEDAAKLVCQSGHTLCGECSAVFCDSLLAAGPEAVMPTPKCSVCRAQIPSLSLERVLTPEQLSTYLSYVAIHTLQDGENLVSCVNCSYCEVRVDEPPIFWCRNQACETVHCVGCKVKLPAMMEEEDVEDSDDEKEFEEIQATHISHLQCSALSKEKAAFDEAIKAGSGMPCPGCGVIGRKDGMCTHMTCSGCETVWCYLCGVSEEDCDKAPRSGKAAGEPIYGHNEDWQTNPLRCPMYMGMIGQIDDEWKFEADSDDDDDEGGYDEEEIEETCLDKFHRWRTLQKLHDLRNKLGESKWRDLRRTFAAVRNCDFTDQEIALAGSVPFFTRPEKKATKQPRVDQFEELD